MPDTIAIEDLEVMYHVGVPDAERAAPQRLQITIRMETDFTAAVARDDVRKTIDYNSVCQRVLKFGEGRSWKLIERLANELANAILREFQPKSVYIEVRKFIIPEARSVSVALRRP